MVYQKIVEGRFLSRPNRFIAHVELDGEVQVCHVKNTGRCRDLLVPGCRAFLEVASNPQRKTKYDLVAVYKGERLINLDSQAPNQVVREFLEVGGLFPKIQKMKPEYTWNQSRFDFYVETPDEKHLLEVKGVTLEEEGRTFFPDAPTQRGVKHLQELIACQEEGYQAHLLFVIQMEGVHSFSPNDKTHPAFGEALRQAAASGVDLRAYDCRVLPNRLELHAPVKIQL